MSGELLRGIKRIGYTTMGWFRGDFEIKEEITAGGLALAFSSNPREVNKTIDRMRETRAKRSAREGKGSEAPSNITMSRPDKKGKSKFTFRYHDQDYTLEGKPDLKEFAGWITEYTATAESCITCDRLLFPGEPAGAADYGLMHMTFDCCPSGGYFAGHIDKQGKLKPLTAEHLDSVSIPLASQQTSK